MLKFEVEINNLQQQPTATILLIPTTIMPTSMAEEMIEWHPLLLINSIKLWNSYEK